MDTEIRSLSKKESSLYLDSIYKLNQENTPEVGSLENIDHLKSLISMSTLKLSFLSDLYFLDCQLQEYSLG